MEINERFIQLAGPKAGGSQTLTVPFELKVDEDVIVTINHHDFIFNVVKQETFSNQDGTGRAFCIVFLLPTSRQRWSTFSM